VLFKAFESILAARLTRLLEGKLAHLFERQYGFRAGRGCDQVLLNCAEALAQHRQLRDFCLVTSLDFSKCYDRVSPHVLTDKVAYLTGNEGFARLVLNMVSGRRIRCVNKHTVSDTLTCQLGIPQGSRIACTLFIVFAFDLFDKLDAISRKGDAGEKGKASGQKSKAPAKASAAARPKRTLRPRAKPRSPPAEATPSAKARAKGSPIDKVDRDRIKTIQYADDANILAFASSQKEVIRLQRKAVESIQQWCVANQMQLNEAKTKYQYHTGNTVLDCDQGSKNPKTPEVEPIGTRGDIQLLGFNLDRNQQFAKLLAKTKGVEAAMKRLHFFKMSPRNKRAYYRAVCESHVRYSAALAPGLTVTQKSQLTASCKRAIATAIGGFSTCSPPKLFEAGDCHPPLTVMDSALIATATNLTDDPWWVRLKEECPGQLLARIMMPSVYLANIGIGGEDTAPLRGKMASYFWTLYC